MKLLMPLLSRHYFGLALNFLLILYAE